MFSDSDRKFMQEEMNIVVDSIESKLNEPFFSGYKQIAIDSISKYINAITKFEATGKPRDLYSGTDNEAEEFIRSHYCNSINGINCSDAIQVLDALRHSFSCYAYNGLHQLYTRQENESWHPKIKLTQILTPNDIDTLDEELALYRGCDISELENNSYGQAWTTSLEEAEKFAYTHYQDQPWFDKSKRIVLKATCSKNHVLFSDQSIEHEVVVDESKMVDVHKHT